MLTVLIAAAAMVGTYINHELQCRTISRRSRFAFLAILDPMPARERAASSRKTSSVACTEAVGDVDKRQKGKLRVGVDIPAPHEIRAIIPHLQGRWRPLLLTAIFPGLRASELRGLRWADVDLKAGELHVRQRADRYSAIGRPKSASGERTIPLAPILVNTLREWELACPKGELDLVFPSGSGRVQYLSDIVQRGWWPAQIAAGVSSEAGKPISACMPCAISMLRGVSTGASTAGSNCR